MTRYLFFGGKRVAMDREGVLQYLVGDHLGSTSLVMDDQGDKIAESRHYPYGEERWRWPRTCSTLENTAGMLSPRAAHLCVYLLIPNITSPRDSTRRDSDTVI